MNALGESFALLRDDLLAAAGQASAVRGRRRRQQAIAACGVAAAGLLFAGLAAADVWPWQTSSQPTQTIAVTTTPPTPVSPFHSGDASRYVSALATTTNEALPVAVRASLATSARHFGTALTGRARMLRTEGTTARYAAPMSGGAVCFALVDAGSPAGSCASTLAANAPLAVIVGQLSDGQTVVAGVAADQVASVAAINGDGRKLCAQQVKENAIVCKTNVTVDTVKGFVVTLRDGTTVKQPA